jgi:hypothetical protein
MEVAKVEIVAMGLEQETRILYLLQESHDAGVTEGLRRAESPERDPLVEGIQHCLRLIPELMDLEPRLARELAGKLHDRLKAFDAKARPERPEPTGPGTGEC